MCAGCSYAVLCVLDVVTLCCVPGLGDCAVCVCLGDCAVCVGLGDCAVCVFR